MSGLFGKSKSTSTIPDWVRQPAEQNMANARAVAALGYVPYYGADVAAFTPMQEASFQNTADAMTAFGMAAPSNPMAGMPEAQTFAGGVRGYSSAPMYEAAVEALRTKNPAQYAAIMAVLGQLQAQAAPAQAVMPVQYSASSGGSGGSAMLPRSTPYTSLNTPLSYAPGGVNTRNPSSTFNQTVARMTSSPTTLSSSSRPAANPRR